MLIFMKRMDTSFVLSLLRKSKDGYALNRNLAFRGAKFKWVDTHHITIFTTKGWVTYFYEKGIYSVDSKQTDIEDDLFK